MQLAARPLDPLLYDNWAVCPICAQVIGTPLNERDGTVHFEHWRAAYRCDRGHAFVEQTALWEVESR